MPNSITPTVQPGQRSQDLQNFILRILPVYSQPTWYDAERWRRVVRNQPIAISCRETLISYLNSLDWNISSRDSSQRDELKDEIKYYEKLFTNFSGLDFSSHLEWLCTDMLDLPFGGASEIGREGDSPDGRVLWIQNLDGGTLAPTLNLDYPVIQRVPNSITNPVVFPAHAIDRIYMSPRPDITREGWGLPPPEKIYLALEMLWRGDMYYASLLLDTPEAGILDLGDMSKTSAEEWVQSFRTMVAGVDPLKIPVLYEHTSQVKFMPFGQPPTALMFDGMMLKYASIVCAGYGMTLEDIGIGGTSGGDTLAGTIRGERKTRRAGFATAKKKTVAYFNRILPDTLQFKWIDLDDEVVQNLGRARLSSASAFTNLVNLRAFTPLEVRQQLIADGLVNIPMKEKPDESEFNDTASKAPTSRNPDTGDQTANNAVNPSMGGWGAIKSVEMEKEIRKACADDKSEETKEMLKTLHLATEEVVKHETEFMQVAKSILDAKKLNNSAKEVVITEKKKLRKKRELKTNLLEKEKK